MVVRVAACAVAYRDILDRSGAFPFIKEDIVLGHEFAGTVAQTGPNANAFEVGQQVVSLHWAHRTAWPTPDLTGKNPTFLGLTADGGYAEYCTVDETAFVPVPSGWSAIEAAPVMSTYGTVWHGAITRGALKAGETVLITGASGGVGTAAVQICKLLGCRVIAVTSSDTKRPKLLELGADEVIVAQGGDKFYKHKGIAADGGVHMVIECVGGACFESSLRSLRPEGRLVLVGNVENSVSALPLGLVILKSLAVIGSDSVSAPEMARVFAFLDGDNALRQRVRPTIHAVLPLEAAADAHRLLEGRKVTGRVVLRVSAHWE